jgi:hypothetical protein
MAGFGFDVEMAKSYLASDKDEKLRDALREAWIPDSVKEDLLVWMTERRKRLRKLVEDAGLSSVAR